MLYVITGEDIVSSRKKLNELLELSTDIARLDGKKATIAEVEMALVSNALFSDQRKIVIEYFSKVKPQEKLIEHAKRVENDKDTDIILWDVTDPGAKIRAVKSAKSFSYTFPKVYFNFMDGLTPANSSSVKIYREVLKTYEPEQILYSIIKRIRQLLILKSDNYQQFEEFAKMQEWQIGRLKSQASKWSEKQLSEAFLKYSALDEKIKTSGLTMDLSKHLDIILTQDLN